MATNASLRAILGLDVVGNYVILQCWGVTRGSVQVARMGTGVNITTTFKLEYSNDGATFLPYKVSPGTINLNDPVPSITESPTQVGCTEPFTLNAMWIKVSVKENPASGDFAYVDLLALDESSPGGSYVQSLQMGAAAVPTLGGSAVMPEGTTRPADQVVS